MRIPAQWVTAVLALVAGLTLTESVATASPASGAASSAGTTCTVHSSAPADLSTPLDGICEYLEGREGVVQVALFDNTTRRSYRLSTGDQRQYTASIVKVDILAKWLRELQTRRGTIPGNVPYSLRYLMQNMIQHSDNVAATALFFFGGGCRALTRFNRLIPLPATVVACETQNYYGWGNTTTTAADQVDLMRLFAYGRPRRVLGENARSYGLQLMQDIQPDQRFGISCGPWGTSCDPPNYAQPVPGVTVALKNGWKTLPTCTQPIEQCPWQVNSTGWVNGQGRDYALTVLTTDDPVGSGGLDGYKYGIETIQNVSRRVWDNLPSPPESEACLDARAALEKAKKRLKRARDSEKESKIKRAKKKRRKAKQAVRDAC